MDLRASRRAPPFVGVVQLGRRQAGGVQPYQRALQIASIMDVSPKRAILKGADGEGSPPRTVPWSTLDHCLRVPSLLPEESRPFTLQQAAHEDAR